MSPIQPLDPALPSGQHSPWDEAHWASLRAVHFPFARINLNPGTLGAPSVVASTTARERLAEVLGYPLGIYQMGRAALQSSRELASLLWPQDSHALAIGPPMTTSANLWTHGLAGHWPTHTPIRVLSTHHEHYGCLSSFARHPRMEVTYLDEADIAEPQRFVDVVNARQPHIAIFSHLTYGTGRRFPVVLWDELLQEHCPDCIVIVDVAHTIGQEPIPFPAGDVVLGSTHKWLCGPWELGLTWLRKDRMERLPALFLTDHPLDVGVDEDHPNLGATYEISGGQRFAKYIELEETLRYQLAWSQARLSARSHELADTFAEGCRRIFPEGGPVRVQKSDCAMILLHFGATSDGTGAKVDPYPVYRRLNELGVHVKCIKSPCGPSRDLHLLRVGFPFYETHERIGRALAFLEESWREVR